MMSSRRQKRVQLETSAREGSGRANSFSGHSFLASKTRQPRAVLGMLDEKVGLLRTRRSFRFSEVASSFDSP
jgi:hypothetical protein